MVNKKEEEQLSCVKAVNQRTRDYNIGIRNSSSSSYSISLLELTEKHADITRIRKNRMLQKKNIIKKNLIGAISQVTKKLGSREVVLKWWEQIIKLFF